MKHVMVCESRRIADNIIMNDLIEFYGDFVGTTGGWSNVNDYYIRTIYSGRVDSIKLISSERKALGHRFDGRLMIVESNTLTESWLMYLRHDRAIKREPVDNWDQETKFWDWFLQDKINQYHPDNEGDQRDIFTKCLK